MKWMNAWQQDSALSKKANPELSTCFIGSKPSYTKQILVKILLSVEPNVVVVETIACIVCIHAYMHGRHAIIRACISAPQKHRCPARPCPGSTSLTPAQTSTLLNTNPIEHQPYSPTAQFISCTDCHADRGLTVMLTVNALSLPAAITLGKNSMTPHMLPR